MILASSSEVCDCENSSHRRVLLRGTARLLTRCASPFRRKKKTHCSISLDRSLWEEERKTCATCRCSVSHLAQRALDKQNIGVVRPLHPITLPCHCDVFQTFRLVLLSPSPHHWAARAVHAMYTCEPLNPSFRLRTSPSHSFTVTMPRSPPIPKTASDLVIRKRGTGNDDFVRSCYIGHPPYHAYLLSIPSPEKFWMLAHGSHALSLSLGPASYGHRTYPKSLSRTWHGGV